MSDIAIRVEGLSKLYRIGKKQERYATLRDTIADAFAAPWRWLRNGRDGSERAADSIWALKDVSFEIQHGEVVGIIGRNGAGKSTLLKILSRITEPTEGRVEIYGRVASLLEVGTGFHPELTGRENIYLNGAILGMRKAEIDRKFDEIVDFAEIEKFIDTPVKRYSSGMYVRLAFAVAAHLEPEILLVDEVLAVGDAAFQNKCLGKMAEIARQGRTILLVSHNMAAIRQLCKKGLLLDSGSPLILANADQVVDQYLRDILAKANSQSAIETTSFIVHKVSIESPDGPFAKTFAPLSVTFSFTPKVDVHVPDFFMCIASADDQRLAGLNFRDLRPAAPIRAGARATVCFRIKETPLLPGRYHLQLQLKDALSRRFEMLPVVFPFEVVETPVYCGRKTDPYWYGFVALRAEAELWSEEADVSVRKEE